MTKPHKHRDLIVAWANGFQIQIYSAEGDEWLDYSDGEQPAWSENHLYRLKPEPKPDMVYYAYFEKVIGQRRLYSVVGTWNDVDKDALKLVFDGETGKLKEAIVL